MILSLVLQTGLPDLDREAEGFANLTQRVVAEGGAAHHRSSTQVESVHAHAVAAYFLQSDGPPRVLEQGSQVPFVAHPVRELPMLVTGQRDVQELERLVRIAADRGRTGHLVVRLLRRPARPVRAEADGRGGDVEVDFLRLVRPLRLLVQDRQGVERGQGVRMGVAQ